MRSLPWPVSKSRLGPYAPSWSAWHLDPVILPAFHCWPLPAFSQDSETVVREAKKPKARNGEAQLKHVILVLLGPHLACDLAADLF